MSLPILPTVSTSCIVISGLFVAIGWNKIRQRKIEQHKNMMIIAAFFAFIFFAIYLTRTVFIGNTSFGGPLNLKVFYTIFLVFHITLATAGAILGIFQLFTGLKAKYKLHRKVGPAASVIWFFTGITGVVVYLLLYVFYQGGETTSMIKAILGT